MELQCLVLNFDLLSFIQEGSYLIDWNNLGFVESLARSGMVKPIKFKHMTWKSYH